MLPIETAVLSPLVAGMARLAVKPSTSASDLDIDHVVALKWTYERGVSGWPNKKKAKFANDPLNLLIVQDRLNQSKGEKPPSEWMPPNHKYRCEYLDLWVLILDKYKTSKCYQAKNVYLVSN